MDIRKVDLDRLRAERVAKKLTQEKIAEIMGVSKSKISKWETGAINLNIDDFVKFISVLGFSIEEIPLFFTHCVPVREQKVIA